MAHHGIPRHGHRVDVLTFDPRLAAERGDQAIDPVDKRAVNLTGMVRHGMMHAGQDIAAECDLGVLDTPGEHVFLLDIVIEQRDEIRRPQVQRDGV